MNFPLKINAILAAIILLLAGLAWYSVQQEKQSPDTLLTGLQPEQVTHISIHNRSSDGFVLELKNDTWIMTSPYQAPANGNRIQRLLEITRSISVSRFPAPEKLQGFGLASPLAKLQLNQTEIIVGGTHPMNRRRYLLLNDQVHLINDRFIHHLQARAEQFVAHRLIPAGSRIRALKTDEWSISKGDDGTTQLSPVNISISNDKLNQKLDSWKTAIASGVVAAPEKTGDRKIEIKLQGPETITFEVEKNEIQTMLIRRDLGLAYILPITAKLLDPPSGAK